MRIIYYTSFLCIQTLDWPNSYPLVSSSLAWVYPPPLYAHADDGVFGTYFQNMIQSCNHDQVITGFSNGQNHNYGKATCQSTKKLLGIALGTSVSDTTQAIIGFDPNGNPQYTPLFWKAKNSNTIITNKDVEITGNTHVQHIKVSNDIDLDDIGSLKIYLANLKQSIDALTARVDTLNTEIRSLKPISCSWDNRALQWTGSAWNCVTIKKGDTNNHTTINNPPNNDPTGVHGIFSYNLHNQTHDLSKRRNNFVRSRLSGARIEDIEWCGTITRHPDPREVGNNSDCIHTRHDYKALTSGVDIWAYYDHAQYTYTQTISGDNSSIHPWVCYKLVYRKKSTGEQKWTTLCGTY